MITRQQRKCRFGFTLIEVMVVVAIFGLLLTVLLGVFSQSRTSLNHAVNRLDLTGRARIPIDRVGFYLSSTIDNNGLPGLAFPKTNTTYDLTNPKTWPRHIVFTTTEDFCDSAYQPDRTLVEFGTGYYIFRSPPTFYYLIWFETGDGGDNDCLPGLKDALMITKLKDPGGLAGKALDQWAETPWANLSTSSTVKPRVVASNIQDIRFNQIEADLLQMRVETQGRVTRASGQTETDTYVQDAVLQMPGLSLSN